MLGAWHYKLDDINDAICKEAGPCQLHLLLPQTKYEAVDGFMNSKNLLPFLKWVLEGEPAMEYVCGSISKAIKEAEKLSRKTSKKYRWHVALDKGISAHTVRSCFTPTALIATMYRNYATEAKTSWQIFPRCAQTVTPRRREATAGERSASASLDVEVRLFFYIWLFAKETLAEPIDNLR